MPLPNYIIETAKNKGTAKLPCAKALNHKNFTSSENKVEKKAAPVSHHVTQQQKGT